MKTVAILGGGISGLSAAYFLSRASSKYRIHLIEASSHFGGWLQSERRPSGALIEYGTRTINIRPTHTALHEIIDNLGLRLERVPQNVLSSRYMFTQNQVVPIPNSPVDLLRSPLTKNIPCGIVRDLCRMKTVSNASEHKSISQFFGAYFSTMDTRLVSSFIHGVYGGDIESWDARALFPDDVVFAEQSAIRAAISSSIQKRKSNNEKEKRPERCVGSFQDGVEELPRALMDMLKKQPHVSVHSKSPCTNIQKDSASEKIIVTTPTNKIEADLVISCLGANALKHCVSNVVDDFIEQTPFSTMATVTLVFDPQLDLPLKPTLGYLVPASEKIPVLGVVFDSFAFKSRQKPNTTVLTVILGGKHLQNLFPEIKNVDTGSLPSKRVLSSDMAAQEKPVYDYALKHLLHALNIQTSPSESFVAIHPKALPNYTVGYKERSELVRAQLDRLFDGRLFLAGNNWGDGIGVGDVVQTSKRIAETIING